MSTKGSEAESLVKDWERKGNEMVISCHELPSYIGSAPIFSSQMAIYFCYKQKGIFLCHFRKRDPINVFCYGHFSSFEMAIFQSMDQRFRLSSISPSSIGQVCIWQPGHSSKALRLTLRNMPMHVKAW